ncbi:hypothetical protein OsI_12186 [Oryza sativa Indica Group]|uniref:Uncharacterized protein n=1 Tax=Oryza sativa subsp. indica TaxID=39946 RepID=A2XIC4_ORYSI|nr:hypothetical protein OsI_12186 [Oryza sativa Indica Group]
MARRDGHHTHSATDRCVVADRFEVDPWQRVGGEQELQTVACGGGDGAVGLSFETHHGGGVAPSPELAACAASSCSAEIMVLLLLQRGELLVHHDRPSHHHRRRFPTPQPAEAAAAVEVGWGFQFNQILDVVKHYVPVQLISACR